MPRKEIGLESTIDYLSILDTKGKPDKDLEPRIGKELLLDMHRAMVRARRFDEHQLRWQRQGRLGTFAPVIGQEASQIGTVAVLDDQDWMVPAYRQSAAALWRGTPLAGLLLYNAGYNEGGEIPEGQNDLPIAIPVASQIPHAVGIGYALKQEGSGHLAMTYFGDGATSEGDFHEAMNFAGVFNTPTIFVCENNQYAISVPREKQTRAGTLAQKAIAYGIPGIQVDGNDILAVYSAASEAAERARKGDGPTLIECVTYRMAVHTTADDPGKYRTQKEEEQWQKKDPIERFRKYLTARKLLNKKKIESLEEELEKEVKSAWDEAEQRMAELDRHPEVMFDHLYGEMPAYLGTQRKAMTDEDDDANG